jgi:hypothetical protein
MALTDNLLAFYKFDNTDDSSGNEYALTNEGGVAFSSGKIGDAAVFDGTTFLYVEDNSSFAFSGDFSISAYFKLTQAMSEDSFQHIVQGVATGDAPGNWFFGVGKSVSWVDNRDVLVFGTHWGTYAPIAADFLPTVDTWYHVGVKRNSGTVSLYVNGQVIGTASDSDARSASGLSFGKSDGSGSGSLYGYVDAFGIWDRALSDSEITALYNSGNGLELTGTPSVNLTNGLEAFYKLENTSDSSGNGNTLTNNGATFASGKIGNAAIFDGSGYLTTSSNINVGQGNFTLNAWVNFANLGENIVTLLQMHSNGQTNGLSLYYGVDWYGAVNELVVASYGISNQFQQGWAPSLNTWHNVIVTRKGTTLKVYIDGVLLGSSYDATQYTPDFLQIGADSDFPMTYSLSIDAVGIWNRALNSAEVAALYNSGTGVELTVTLPVNLNSGLQAFYKLEDTSDSSGNGNALTVNGDVTFSSGKIGNGAVFDGASSLQSIPLPSGGSEFSVNLWVKPINRNDPSGDGIISINQYFDGLLFRYGGQFNDPFYLFGTYSSIDTETELQQNVWSNVVITANGSLGKLYINGLLKATISYSGTLSEGSNLTLGYSSHAPSEALNGQIDAVGIWNRALNSAEVAALYNSGAGLELPIIGGIPAVRIVGNAKFFGNTKFV